MKTLKEDLANIRVKYNEGKLKPEEVICRILKRLTHDKVTFTDEFIKSLADLKQEKERYEAKMKMVIEKIKDFCE